MKLIKLASTGILSIVLLTGCTNSAAPQQKEESKVEQVKAVAEVNDPKAWKDISTPEGFNEYGIEPTLKAWIAFHAGDVPKTTDVNEYYPRAKRLTTEYKYFRVQGDDLQKDFENLNVLQIWMGHLEYVLSRQNTLESDRAKFNDDLKKSFKYFTEMLHDLDIVINYDGKGETFGLTRQLDGNKVKELESYLYVN
ncbi:hypothetical protein P4562_16715 [Lysinibacillus xylanilyticus]|uniref:hypothetical protein n=1 Tax=Lysinibacillus xylanilyticus TaxID=582475 RepID=UPI002E23DEBE|nr:hypothetical protein [Lysinibacillus xylanilyticus]